MASKFRTITRTQALSPWGIGAIVDFSDESLMAAGLDVWPIGTDNKWNIYDERLAKVLMVDHFKMPPSMETFNTSNRNERAIPFVRFPLWYFCPKCRSMTKVRWNDKASPTCTSSIRPSPKVKSCAELGRKKPQMVPVQFVSVCEKGHISDFPWIEWAHSNSTLCPTPLLRIQSRGKTGLAGLLVECVTCGAKRSLRGATGMSSSNGLTCTGERPWLGPHGTETCELQPITLHRGASNIYFPELASSILIPPYSDKYRDIIDDPNNWQTLTAGHEMGKDIDDERIILFADIKKLDYSLLKSAIVNKLTNRIEVETLLDDDTRFRHAEYQALLKLNADVGSQFDEYFLSSEQDISNYEDVTRKFIERVVIVERLAETRVLTGFSRINPPQTSLSNSDTTKLSLSYNNWLPGIRVYGEGIFFSLNEDAIKKWLSSGVSPRYTKIIENAAVGFYHRQGLTPTFFLLHTLAHFFIRSLSYNCGYGSSSIRERIYFSDKENLKMRGILIYTAAGDSEGTMGGLIEQAKPGNFDQLLVTALENAIWCSNDPMCAESRGQGVDSLNIAACHACALLPETSCEEGNRFLDRISLVGTPERQDLGFFNDLVKTIIEK